MKRSVAVTGPTPAFIRWAIFQACSLREIEVENLPDATFRQLRSVAELSVASRQGRVFESVCVAADAEVDVPQEARGFPVDEVVELYGDADRLQKICGQCKANCWPEKNETSNNSSPLSRLAGCFGMLPTAPSWNLDPSHAAVRSREVNHVSIPDLVRDAADGKSDLLSIFPESVHPFYALWQRPFWSPKQSAAAGQLFEAAAALAGESDFPDLRKLIVACQQCHRYGLKLYVELVPSGLSDGIHWRRSPCCSRCRFVHAPHRRPNTPCRGCGGRASDLHVPKAKVLGRRPYLLLEKIFGREATVNFLDRYGKQCTPR